MFNFTEEQRFAALTLGQPIVVTAAAGSGKTTVLVARYLELLKQGLKPHEILTVTFTTDAANQLRHRIIQALDFEPHLVTLAPEIKRNRFIGTIHSFCYYLLQEYGSVLSYPPVEEILSEYRFQTEIETSYRAWLHKIPKSELQQILSILPRHELRQVFCEFYDSKWNFESFSMDSHPEDNLRLVLRSMQPYLEQLQQHLFDQGLFRFDDLEHLSFRILAAHPAVKSRLQQQFKAFLIDEFQDTSQVQWAIFKQLLGESFEKLFVVGDPKQSIYAFRHADVAIFFEVSELTRKQNGNIAELNTNFRTQSTLISDINSYSQAFFKDSLIPFQPMVSGKSLSGDPVHVVWYGESLDNEIEVEKKADPKILELDSVISAIEKYLEHGHSPKDLTLLFRMGDRIETYAQALQSKNLSVECTQTVSLFSHYDILDFLFYLKALLQPKDTFSLSSFLYSPWVGASLETLAQLRDEKSEAPFEERAKQLYGAQLNWFFELAAQPYVSLRSAIYHLFGNSSYFPHNPEPFLEILKPLSEKHYSIQDAVSAMELWKKSGILFQAKSGNALQGGIKLMTVHASKGLEFEHVFLVDCLRKSPSRLPTLLTHPNEAPSMKYRESQETVLPHQYLKLKEMKEKLDLEESRRILYVAMTRAKQSLTLFLPKEMKGVPQGSWAQILRDAQ